jgi:hypothetical protein
MIANRTGHRTGDDKVVLAAKRRDGKRAARYFE